MVKVIGNQWDKIACKFIEWQHGFFCLLLLFLCLKSSSKWLFFYLLLDLILHRSKIDKGIFTSSMTQLSGWESIMGLQFENLVVHNRKVLWKMLGISPDEIVMEGPFFQTATTKQAGCQVDYMIQTRFHNLYLCEIKFSKNSIGKKIITDMEKKRKNLNIPKYCSIRPILIHVNGVDERYFDRIVDFGELLSQIAT